MLKLIVNADDFGHSDIVNKAVLTSYQNGILRSASLMANGSSFENAAKIIRDNPLLDIGMHITLVGEKPILVLDKIPTLVDENGNFSLNAIDFTKRYYSGKISFEEVKGEIIAQIEKILDYGIRISHIDSHQHLHLLPQIFNIISEIVNRYKIKFVRYPKEKFSAYMFNDLRSIGRIFQMAAINFFCYKTMGKVFTRTDYFTGFYFGGNLNKKNLITLINCLPSRGICELMCHPGLSHDISVKNQKQYRLVEEVEALIDGEVFELIKRKRIEITTFRALSV